jgi:hypothetical protein
LGGLGDRRARIGLIPAPPWIPALAWILCIAGLVAYNWWLLVPLKPGLMRSPDEFFSNLEVTGRPYAALMQHADLISGVLLLAAFAIVGSRSVPGARREWLAMMAFAAAGAVGGVFSQVCADGVSPACMSREWHFQLPASQYVHDGAGIVEFAGITLALLLAWWRTRDDQTWTARTYRGLLIGAVAAYPFLGLAYLLDRLGGVMEAVFFTGFTVMAILQVAERAAGVRRGRLCSVAGVEAGPGSRASEAMVTDMETAPGTSLPSPAPLSLSARGCE